MPKDNLQQSFNSLSDMLIDVVSQLESQNILEMSLSDLVEFIPSYSAGTELDATDLKFLADSFLEFGLSSQPHVKGGYIARGVGTPIYLFRDRGEFDHRAENYRYGLRLVQVAVIFARIDGEIVEQEILHIEKIIQNLKFLSEREKTELTATALYFLNTSTGIGGSEQARDYLKVGLSKNLAIRRIKNLSSAGRVSLIEMIKEVITADGLLRKPEIGFLQDIYKEFGLSARSVKPDLEKYAKDNYISLSQQVQQPLEPAMLEEVDDVLADLISDFDDFSYAD